MTDGDFTYDFSHEKRGIALLIHNEEFDIDCGYKNRPGDAGDYVRMKEVFSALGFDVHPYRNLTATEMWSTVKRVSQLADIHKKSDCFMCVIASHGEEMELRKDGNIKIKEHVIIGKDGNAVKTSNIVKMFDDDHCENLQNKPKFFFFQACRTSSNTILGMDQGHTVTLTDKTQLTSNEEESQQEINVQLNKIDNADSKHSPSDFQQSAEDTPQTKDDLDTKHLSFADMYVNSRPLVHHVTDVDCPDDTLLMFASLSNNFAVRNASTGGWLLTSLYSQLKEHMDNGKLWTTEFVLILNGALKEMTTKNFRPSDTNSPLYLAFSPGCFTHCLTKDVLFTKK